MNKNLTQICSLLAAWLGLVTALPANAALLQLVPNWGASGVPTNLSMYVYVPDTVVVNPPILVLLHYWGGTASSVFAQAQGGGLVAAADQYGFIMVVPQRAADCWDYSSAQLLTHDGGGETHGIAQMVRYAITNYHANSNRVYVAGNSCGGMMTEALLGVYPDMFKAGVAYAGVPIGGQWTPVTHTAQEWGDLARAAYPGYAGPRPRVQLWHGTADSLVNYSNHLEAIMQWGNVLGLGANPTVSNTATIAGVTNQWIHQVWKDTNGVVLLDAWADIGGDHGPSDALFKARYVIPFLGLDKAGPVDPGAGSQRGRPKLNAARTTFVADNGQPLRGPYTSTEWTAATTYDQIAKMKTLGFNAVHLYGESFDPSYPTNGSTAPGYATSRIDSIVTSTRDLGLYLVITIGNGAANGKYNRAYITNFWNLYAARYANETHVMYEIQNEPVAWGPPYSSPTATPPGALDMEVAAYKTIRANAPDTPVLLFTYAVLGDSGGASAALTDIHAFNTNLFRTANVVWTNMAVGFHGYAGASAMSNAVSQVLAAGYPCFMTEFGGGVWGTGVAGLDAYAVANLERLGVSWLTFQYIPPTGVSDDVTVPQRYQDVVNWSGLSWTPDFGNWPPMRGAYGNGGYPWVTPDYNGSGLLTGSLRIQAENFDSGGEGVAYHDTSTVNATAYRTSEKVSLENTTDSGGGYNVTGTATGEWLEYTTYVSQPGLYNLALRVAGTSTGSVQVLAGGINGTNLTGAWTVPATGGAQTWTTISNIVFLTPGQQVLHLDVLSGGFNLNWLQLSPVTSGIIADGTYKLLNRASALAVTGVSSNNTVIASSYSGSTAQQWSLQHIGGGEYKITCVNNGWSLTSGGFYFWNNNRYLIQAAGNGGYRIVPTRNGYCFETTSTNQSVIGEKVSSGSANQQWAIVSPSAPAFPIGLSATAISSTQISLTWNVVAGATSYNVKRSTTSGGAYTTIATGVTVTNYTDTAVAGTTYYYAVSAVIGGLESFNSMEATVTLPFPWMSQDVGSVGVAGSAAYTYSNGVFSLTGSGSDIWGGSDAFRFAYVPVTGNCTIVARVLSLQNVDGWSKAGVMIRESLADNAANAFSAVTPGNGVTWQTRSSTGANSGNNAVSGLSAPYWVKLVRSGNTFTGYRSSNGVTWTQLGTATFTMSSTAYIGLALTSHNNSTLCAAAFDNVTAPGWPVAEVPVPTGLAAVSVSTSQINLMWNALTNATSYNVKRSLTNGGPYATIASGVMATNYPDSAVAGGTVYYYVVSAVISGAETFNSAQATATTTSSTHGSLIHRYSFDETGGTSAVDSVGGPVWNGTLPSGGALGGGRLTLSSGSSQYASLPAGIVGSLSNFTIMAWVNLNSVSNWSRIFDFGSGTTTNMFLTPMNGGSSTLRFAITTNGSGSEQQINCSSTLSTGAWHQVAVTLSGATGILYLNGVAMGTNSGMTLKPSSLGSTTQNYLGKSQYPDPYLNGALDEFRIYDAALSAAEIAATAALGSGQLLSTNRPPMNLAQTGTNLMFSWPLANAGFNLQSCTNLASGIWENVTSPVPQIIGGQWQVALPPSGNSASFFYRLAK